MPDYTNNVKGTDAQTKYTGILYATDKVSTGFTFTENLAYYLPNEEGKVPSPRMKCDYNANDASKQIYNKTEDPFAIADFTNGVFTTKQAYASYGAKR